MAPIPSLENPTDQTWHEYRRLVLGELERLARRIEEVNSKADAQNSQMAQRIDALQSGQLGELRIEMAQLKARSGIFGGLMGALTGIAAAIGSYLMAHKG